MVSPVGDLLFDVRHMVENHSQNYSSALISVAAALRNIAAYACVCAREMDSRCLRAHVCVRVPVRVCF